MGCLTAPFRLVGFLGFLVILAIGWLYRDRLVQEAHELLGSITGSDATPTGGRPGSRALLSAHAKIDSLNGWRADSVVLTASEVASMIGAGLDPSLRSQLDSLQIELQDGSITVKARLATARLPRGVIRTPSVGLRPTEPIQAAGPPKGGGPPQAERGARVVSRR